MRRTCCPGRPSSASPPWSRSARPPGPRTAHDGPQAPLVRVPARAPGRLEDVEAVTIAPTLHPIWFGKGEGLNGTHRSWHAGHHGRPASLRNRRAMDTSPHVEHHPTGLESRSRSRNGPAGGAVPPLPPQASRAIPRASATGRTRRPAHSGAAMSPLRREAVGPRVHPARSPASPQAAERRAETSPVDPPARCERIAVPPDCRVRTVPRSVQEHDRGALS